jgi:hypothetical protein
MSKMFRIAGATVAAAFLVWLCWVTVVGPAIFFAIKAR